MTEQKVKKRAWVKDAAIIFLTVMLVLTFFSNTIMNHSLPEVAAEYVQSGSINAKIRGTGTVTANESYEVKSEQIREVLSVPVQVGDKVEVGDILILLADAESSQVQETQDALDALVLAYKKALINTNSSDYAKENRDIQLAQQALDKSKAEKNANLVSDAQFVAAKSSVEAAQKKVDEHQANVDYWQRILGTLTPGEANGSVASTVKKQLDAKTTEINTTKKDIKATQGNGYYLSLLDYAAEYKKIDGNSTDPIEKYISLLVKHFSTKPGLPYSETSLGEPDKAKAQAMVDTYNELAALESRLSTLEAEKNELESAYVQLVKQLEYYEANANLEAAKKKLNDYKKELTNCENAVKDLEEKKAKYKEADTAVTTNQKNLEDLLFALAEKKKTDGKIQASETLDLEAQRTQIERKRGELEKLKAGGDGASVESKVNGTVSAINVSAGKTSQPDTPLMVIEVPDMGYGISFPVTAEQSKKVKIGDQAEIMYYYSSDSVSATLVGIKTDPQNPGKSKLLCFKLQGEVETGTQLTVSIGERGGNYETIVPNSAVRSDNNGSFVLAVMAKSSPLGNRFVAQRIDVKVLASDDVKSAVSGALTNSDMVITTSNKPVESGALVRMPD